MKKRDRARREREKGEGGRGKGLKVSFLYFMLQQDPSLNTATTASPSSPSQTIIVSEILKNQVMTGSCFVLLTKHKENHDQVYQVEQGAGLDYTRELQ